MPAALLEAARAEAERVGASGAALAFLEARARAHDGGRAEVFGVEDPVLGARPAGAAGRLYEALLADGARRGLGAFYTPEALADRLVEAALAADGDAEGALPLVVDPACGAGAFLLAAARRLEARAARAGHADPRAAAAGCLAGVDKDPGAIEICRAVLAAEGYVVPADRLVAADALAAPWPVERAGAVVGNPPFVNIVRLPDDERAALKARYRTFRNKCDLYGLFVEAAADHLAPGGRLALILSDSFLGAASFAPLRRLLFDDEAIACRSIDRIEGSAFAAAVHPMAVVAERRRVPRAAGTSGNHEATIRFGTLDATGRPGASVHLDAARLARRAHRSVAMPADPEDLAVAEAMEEGTVSLGALASLSLGVKTGDDARFVSETRAAASFVPCVRGRSLARYRARRDGFLDYRPEVLRTVHGARPRRIESFDRPLKILLRETSGARLVAAMDTARLVPLDTVHAIFHHESDAPPACSLWYLLAVLCAAPTSYWYGQHHPGAHVKAAEVRALPVPPPQGTGSPASPARLATAVADAVLFLARGDPGAVPPAACLEDPVRHALLDLLARELSRDAPEDAHRAAAVALVDAIVAHAYGVTAAEPPVDHAGARRYRLLR